MARNDKQCVLCRRWKNRSEFNKRKRSRDGLQNVCRICNAERSRRYYRENHEKHLRDTIDRNRRYGKELRRRVDAVKRVNGCVFCSEREPVALDFHHRGDKEDCIATMIAHRRSWKRSVAEILKCVVVCASCHRKVTAGILQIPKGSGCQIPNDLGV